MSAPICPGHGMPCFICPVEDGTVKCTNKSSMRKALSIPDVTGLTVPDAALKYAECGWYVLPVDPETKHPGSLVGMAWQHQSSRDPEQIREWWARWPDASLAGHTGRSGLAVLDADRVALFPAGLRPSLDGMAYQSTRADGSGRGHYAGTCRPMEFGASAAGLPGDWGEVRSGNSVIILEPSPHVKAADGGCYLWERRELRPVPDDIAACLRPPGASHGTADSESVLDFLASLPSGPEPCPLILAELGKPWEASRHPHMLRRTMTLARLGEQGHHGAAAALDILQDSFTAEIEASPGDRKQVNPDKEYGDALAGAVATVLADPTPDEDKGCCGALSKIPLAPFPSGQDNGAVEAFTFDPEHAHDHQALGDACLSVMQLQARYAADAGLWLTSRPERWEALTADITPWIVSSLADYMPPGISLNAAIKNGFDPQNPDPAVTAEISRYERRKMMRGNSGAGAVAAKMRSRVAVPGAHPSALRLADLDADPGIIWAGGIPWDIAKSRGHLVQADTDPGTPHLQACQYKPDASVPTPLWDAFVTAVWPHDDIREWALRLASLGVTGHGEKAFPLLSGETDTGKTSLAEMVADVLGSYAVTVAPELLTGSTGGAAQEYARFDLKGVRLAFLDESPRTGKLAQNALKNLTGGGSLHGRPPYGKPVTFRASHTLIATANPESDPPMTDDAVRGRIRLIPCAGSVEAVRAAREAIGHLHGGAWQREAPGVLAMLIMKAAEVMADPGSVRNDKAPVVVQLWGEHMAGEQDTVARWIAAELEPWAAETRGSELYEEYVSWCRRNDAKPESPVQWGRRMTKLGSAGRRSHGITWYALRTRSRGVYGTWSR